MSHINAVILFVLRFVIGYSAVIGIVYISRWTYDNYIDTFKLPYIKQPIEIMNENKIIAVGEPIRMKLEINKPELLEVIASNVNIVCDSGNLITMAINNNKTLPVGEYVIYSDNYLLPNKINDGDTCQFNFINTYRINDSRQSDAILWSSEKFTVVKERD